MSEKSTIVIRRTTALDYRQEKWIAIIDLRETLGSLVWPVTGSKAEPECLVTGFASTPEQALRECYVAVGSRACMMQLPAPLLSEAPANV